MSAIRFAVSWALYWLGDLVSKIDNWPILGWTTLYPIYNALMGWSSNVQGTGRNGPWIAVAEDDVSNAVRVAKQATGEG